MQGTSTELRTLVEAVADGRLHPVIDSRYPLADIVAADRRLAERKNFGKVVLTP
jgi:NADPH:quinone reductase-like Zn-dependent oxidoreductase